MRVLLVDSIGNERSYVENKYPSIGLGYLASYLRKHLSDIEIKIASIDIENVVRHFKPDLVGISSVTQNFNRARDISSLCKEFNLPVIIGGIHISSLPLCLNKNMDIGVIGEGEETFLELVKLYLDHGKWDNEKLRRIGGIAYRSNNNIELTSSRNLIEPLDQLPFPARDLLKNEGNEAYMFSSRGCLYRCIFCASSRFWKRCRFFSAEYVIKEIKDILNHYPHVRVIKMFDDLFIGNRERLREITRLILREGLNRRVRFLVSATANLIDDEIVALMKEMNVREVGMGLESGSENILKYLKRGIVSIKDSYNAVKKLKENGIWVTSTFIIGSPHETREDIMRTFGFIRKLPLDKFTTFVLIPYPNTPLWNLVIDRGLLPIDDIDRVDWNVLNQDFFIVKDNAPILSNELSRQEILDLLGIFRKEERRFAAKWALKLVIMQPSKVINHILKRIKRFA